VKYPGTHLLWHAPTPTCSRVGLDATVTVMIITFCGCDTADYFGRVGELFTEDIAEK
jgi:hypothetical protein